MQRKVEDERRMSGGYGRKESSGGKEEKKHESTLGTVYGVWGRKDRRSAMYRSNSIGRLAAVEGIYLRNEDGD